MQATIEGDELVIRLPISPRTSKSGKSLVVASSGGNQKTQAEYEGQQIVVGVNAYVKK